MKALFDQRASGDFSRGDCAGASASLRSGSGHGRRNDRGYDRLPRRRADKKDHPDQGYRGVRRRLVRSR